MGMGGQQQKVLAKWRLGAPPPITAHADQVKVLPMHAELEP